MDDGIRRPEGRWRERNSIRISLDGTLQEAAEPLNEVAEALKRFREDGVTQMQRRAFLPRGDSSSPPGRAGLSLRGSFGLVRSKNECLLAQTPFLDP